MSRALSSEERELIQKQIQLDLEFEKRECERSLAAFTKCAWNIIEPGTKLVWNWHLDVISAYLEAFHEGRINKKLIINVPPGTMKSILVSVMYPAWIWVKDPTKRYLTITNEQGLAIRDALRMKNIVTSEWFQNNWPLALKNDQNEKSLYIVDKHLGHRQAQGINAANTGKRGDLLIIDDPIDAKHAFSEVIRQSVNDTWDQALSSRLNDLKESGVLLIMQRVHTEDLTGHLLKKVKTKWTVLSIPMRYEGHKTYDAAEIGRPDLNDPRTKVGELLFPQKFQEEEVQGLEENLGEYGTAGQLQQRPVADGGGIIKSHWWRIWPDDKPLPVVDHMFLSWDTAFSEKDMKNAAYSAMTRWGIFWHEQRQRYCLLCLGKWFDRVGYDELRAKAKELDKEYDPDAQLIEKKATGITLIQDLRRALPGKVRTYTPGAGDDKISRAHSVSPMFQAGLIYIADKKWAHNDEKTGLIDYVAAFPTGGPPTADLTDTVTQACIYLRKGNWVSQPEDDEPEEPTRVKDEFDDDEIKTRKVIY